MYKYKVTNHTTGKITYYYDNSFYYVFISLIIMFLISLNAVFYLSIKNEPAITPHYEYFWIEIE
jgi:hypothetical protein